MTKQGVVAKTREDATTNNDGRRYDEQMRRYDEQMQDEDENNFQLSTFNFQFN